jgi:very-short-patch-repair endonuclease
MRVDGPFRGSLAVARGTHTWARLRGPSFRWILPDVYAPAELPLDLAVRSRAAYLLVGDRGGVLCGYSAAVLLGTDVAPPGAPAEILVPHRYRRHRGLLVHEGVTSEVVEIGGCRVTSPVHTAWDLCRRPPLDDAVVALDALCRIGGFPPVELLARREACPGARGCRRLDGVVRLADPRAESPQETRLRLDLRRAGLPEPEVQFEIRTVDGVLLARADLAYREVRLAVEYDGATHFTRAQRERDLRRDATLAAYGWQTVRLGRDDLGVSAAARVRAILAARRRAA